MTATNRRLNLYLWAVALAGTPVLVAVTIPAVTGGIQALSLRDDLTVLLFSATLVVGELFPIPVARGAQAGDEITVSSTFGFALLLIAPIAVAIAAQALALCIDCEVRHMRRWRVPFNVSQYGLAFVAARLVYCVASGLAFTPRSHIGPPDFWACVAAAATFLLVNNFLVGVAVSMSTQLRLRRVLRDDLAWQISTSAPLLGLGALGAEAMAWTPFSLVLLMVPLLALHRSGRLAMRREQEALRDGLTGLPNRKMLNATAARLLADGGGQLAMLLLDLDHFKEINDTLGHAVGDEMLLAVGRRLAGLAGAMDLVCRVGGDEFVVLHHGAPGRAELEQLAERLATAVREPVVLNGVTLTVGCSVGIALAPEDATSLADLFRCADIAMYSAKATRGMWSFYDRASDNHSAALLGLPADLRAALEDDGDETVWVAYQPQLDLEAGRVVSVECLARWRHPRSGDIPPEVFVPIAENTSLIDLLFHRVLDLSLAQVTAWEATGHRLNLSVNLSPRNLADMALPDAVQRRLEAHGVDPARLLLEVTEGCLMADPEHSSAVLQRLHAMGVRISIDDFGTGYSSLSYLQRLSVDELKIDRSFIAELAASGNATIVRSTIDLGHNLGLQVVAEGVEDVGTARLLRSLGCDLLQGYLIAEPLPAAQLLDRTEVLPDLTAGRACAPILPLDHRRPPDAARAAVPAIARS